MDNEKVENDNPSLGVDLHYTELFLIFAACRNTSEDCDKRSKFYSKFGPLNNLFLKMQNKKHDYNIERDIDSSAEGAIYFKNLASKFEEIIRSTNHKQLIKMVDDYTTLLP